MPGGSRILRPVAWVTEVTEDKIMAIRSPFEGFPAT